MSQGLVLKSRPNLDDFIIFCVNYNYPAADLMKIQQNKREIYLEITTKSNVTKAPQKVPRLPNET